MELAHWDTLRIQEQSRIPEVDLLYAEFEDEEYIQTEVFEGLSVMWSSNSELSVVINAARKYFGTAEDKDHYWSRVVFNDGSSEEMNPAKIEAAALRREDDVAYYAGAYGEGILSWRIPRIKMIGGEIPHAEVCYTEVPPRLERVLILMGATATPHVVSAIQKDSTPLAQKVNLAL